MTPRPDATGPKGRPTPKRGAAGRGPVAPPPQTRREAAKRLREQQAEGRKGLRAGYVANDESAMLPRDRGPVRRLVRDVVDTRRNVGVLLLPLALLLVAANLVHDSRVSSVAARVWVVGLLSVLVDFVLLALRVRARVAAAHPDERRTGRHVGYALLRSTTFRRFRMPPPQVRPGG